MKQIKLDSTDRTILKALQEDGRATNVDLAHCAGISAPPCLRRIRALEEKGIIKGYHAVVDHQKLGYEMFVFIHISLLNHTPEDTKNFSNLLKQWEEIRACYMLAGETDYLLQVVAKDWSALQDFMTQKLLAIPNVAKVKSYPALRCNFLRPGVPIEIEDEE